MYARAFRSLGDRPTLRGLDAATVRGGHDPRETSLSPGHPIDPARGRLAVPSGTNPSRPRSVLGCGAIGERRQRMARPRLQEHEKRTERHNLRFTLAEIDHINTQAAAAGLDVTEYLRRRALGYIARERSGYAGFFRAVGRRHAPRHETAGQPESGVPTAACALTNSPSLSFKGRGSHRAQRTGAATLRSTKSSTRSGRS